MAELNRQLEPNLRSLSLLYLNKQMVRTRREANSSDYRNLRIIVSPERRCSSRTFRYGYLVTT